MFCMFGCAETYVSGVREAQNICFACLDVLKHMFWLVVTCDFTASQNIHFHQTTHI
jgi:hypothetical protein